MFSNADPFGLRAKRARDAAEEKVETEMAKAKTDVNRRIMMKKSNDSPAADRFGLGATRARQAPDEKEETEMAEHLRRKLQIQARGANTAKTNISPSSQLNSTKLHHGSPSKRSALSTISNLVGF